jgi:hypothetical protein
MSGARRHGPAPRARPSRPLRAGAAWAALALAALAACSGAKDEEDARDRVFSPEGVAAPAPGGAAEGPWDPARPEGSLALGPDEVARRLGSFEWTAAVEWSFSRAGDPPARVHALERHRVRQSATSEFEVESEIDPGLGEGSLSGRTVVFVGGVTYARSRYAPFGQFRERSTDRGRDARRARDETFGVLFDVARLYGPALALEPAGEAKVLDRFGRRYRLALRKEALAAEKPADGRAFPAGGPDPDTRRRLAFLEGAVPLAADGELVLDAETGAPLRARLRGAFGVEGEKTARAQVEIVAQVRALGAAVGAVAAPKGALPDARKPSGVSEALEAAGLKERGEREMGRAEPAEEGE